ncbi:MAG: PxxKW family cysteine-rich protein [Desulfobacterales bacterium]
MAQSPLQKQPIIEKCTGCENIDEGFCRIWAVPAAKWRTGVCPSATHVKVEVKSPEQKVRVGQQKQKKNR